jgi:outer membrane protein assembly factor BamB
MAGTYYVLRAADGTVAAQVECGEPIFSAPVVGDRGVYVATLGSRVYALEADGAVRWVWDFVTEVLKFDGDRWSGAAWAKRGKRVTWREQFCCSRDIACHGAAVVIPAGGQIVWLEDAGDRPVFRAIYNAPDRENPGTLALSMDAAGTVYRQWYRRDNGGRVETLRLRGGTIEGGYVHGTQTSYVGAESMGFSSVSVRGEDVYRVRPEAGHAFSRHRQGEVPTALGGFPAVASPILLADRGVFGGLDGRLYVVPLSGAGEVQSYSTAFGKPITASCAVADGRIYAGSEDGYLYVFGPNGSAALPTKDLELWRIRSPLEGPYADPAYDWYTSFGNFANTNAASQGVSPPFRLRWIRRFDGTVKHFSVGGGGRLYTHTAEGQIFAVEQDTGRLLWHTYFPGVHVSYTSPLYHEGRLYVPQAGLASCRVRCLDAATGSVLWDAPFTGSPSWNRQQPPIVHGDLVFYLFSSGSYTPKGWLFEHQSTFAFPKDQRPLLVAWDRATGAEVWRRDFSAYGAGGDDAGMCLMGGTLYYSCYFGSMEPGGVTAALDPATGRIAWLTTKYAVHAGCTISGKDGRLYLGGYNPVAGTVNHVWCLNAGDGSLIWRSAPVTRAIHVVTIRDDTLFTHAQYMESYLLDRHTGAILDTFRKGYRCTRFTVAEPYLLGANMDAYDPSRGFALVSTGPAVDVLLCVGACVSNGRIFFTANGSGLQASLVGGG